MKPGLSSSDISKLRQRHGWNRLEATNPNTWPKMLLRQFTDLMVIILMVSALLAIGFGLYEGGEGFIDGLVILGIVIVNACIGFYQEFRTERALEALKKLVAPHAIVIRDGKKQQIKAEELLPGDLVVLAAGDKIPADGTLIKAEEVKVDESALTGESVPVHKNMDEDVSMGTTIVAGSAQIIISKIGMETRFGRIASLTTETIKDQSPLQREMTHIGVFVTKVTLAISAVLIATGIFVQGKSVVESLLFAVSVAVAAVPEGLPATLTVALALGVQRMVKKKALVKQLSSVETLGSTTVICSDKTGTLTKNEMTVTKLLLGNEEVLEVSGSGYDPNKGSIHLKKNHQAIGNLELMRSISSFCSDADLQKKGSKYSILGDPTEGALLTLAQKKLLDSKKEPRLAQVKILHELPFDSERKMMSIVVEGGPVCHPERSRKDPSGRVKGGKGALNPQIWTKGSPDSIIHRSKKILINGKLKTFTPALKKQVEKHYQGMAEEALRVIAFAYKPLSKSALKHPKNQEKDLIFVGLAGMIDPPREQVKPAVSLCYKAGIRTIIITGDYGLTAKAIALQIGIADDVTPLLLGSEIDKMNDKQLDKLLMVHQGSALPSQSLIFSRVNPEHKRRIVDRLKSLGEIVAVTGDGVNDAPALKRADLGIAMGITGTEVTKETANVVLLDDSFASIVTAIEEGRKIFNNLRKFTWFMFSCNIGELVTIFAAVLLQIPAPLTAVLILATNVGTDILPGISLGIDHAEPDIMKLPPRDQKAHIMNKPFIMHFLYMGFLIGVLILGIYLWELSQLGWTWEQGIELSEELQLRTTTLGFASLVIIQLFNAFNARSFTHSVFKLKTLWQLWASVGVSVCMVLMMIYLPFFQKIFRTTGLNADEWMLVLGVGVAVMVAEESRKLVLRLRMKVRST